VKTIVERSPVPHLYVFNRTARRLSVDTVHSSDDQGAAASAPSTALKEAREAAGYSIEDLAIATGLTHQEIRDAETGINHDESHLGRIAAALKLAIEYAP
jgi:DNA-binding XRE family transcriptional regulator